MGSPRQEKKAGMIGVLMRYSLFLGHTWKHLWSIFVRRTYWRLKSLTKEDDVTLENLAAKAKKGDARAIEDLVRQL